MSSKQSLQTEMSLAQYHPRSKIEPNEICFDKKSYFEFVNESNALLLFLYF